jgi:hypothetical protein
MWTNPDSVIRIVERQFELLLRTTGPRRLRLLPKTLAFLEREPLANAILRDLVIEAEHVFAEYVGVCNMTRQRLLKVWKQHGNRLMAALQEVRRPELLDAYAEMDTYEQAVTTPSNAFSVPGHFVGDRVIDQSTQKLTAALRHWALSAKRLRGIEDDPCEAWLQEVIDEANEMRRHIDHAFRTLKLATISHGGFSLERLRKIVRTVHPEREDDFAFAIHEQYRAAVLSETLTATIEKTTQWELDRDIEEVEQHGILLRDELHQRLLLGLSRRAVVDRFAAKCETFERMKLQSDGARRSGSERSLTLAFASYLFDSGFTPIIDPEIGGLKPDVLDAAKGSLFYVEAKQYAHRSPKATILAAYRQVWSTWLRIEKQFSLTEGFLVVFRRSGPIVDLPRRLDYGQRRLYSTLIDIAELAGSRERYSPIVIAPELLLPRS